jgi:hypothetical protein
LTAADRSKTLNQELGAEEERRAGEKAVSDSSVTRRGLERLLDKLVGDRADQHAGAEGHDQADVAGRQGDSARDRSADDERGASNEPPEKRLAH